MTCDCTDEVVNVVADHLVTRIVLEPQRRSLHGNEVLIVGSGIEQSRALGQRCGSVPHPQVRGAKEFPSRRIVGLRSQGQFREIEGGRGFELQRQSPAHRMSNAGGD